MLEDNDTKKYRYLTCNMTSSCEKNYKHFINYKDDDHRIKPLRIMLLRTSAYVKCCNGETKWMSFLLKMMSY